MKQLFVILLTVLLFGCASSQPEEIEYLDPEALRKEAFRKELNGYYLDCKHRSAQLIWSMGIQYVDAICWQEAGIKLKERYGIN